MTKTKNVAEPDMNRVIASYEEEGWEFVSATLTSPAGSVIGELSFHSYPATFMLFFKKNEQQHNDVP